MLYKDVEILGIYFRYILLEINAKGLFHETQSPVTNLNYLLIPPPVWPMLKLVAALLGASLLVA